MSTTQSTPSLEQLTIATARALQPRLFVEVKGADPKTPEGLSGHVSLEDKIQEDGWIKGSLRINSAGTYALPPAFDREPDWPLGFVDERHAQIDLRARVVSLWGDTTGLALEVEIEPSNFFISCGLKTHWTEGYAVTVLLGA